MATQPGQPEIGIISMSTTVSPITASTTTTTELSTRTNYNILVFGKLPNITETVQSTVPTTTPPPSTTPATTRTTTPDTSTVTTQTETEAAKTTRAAIPWKPCKVVLVPRFVT